MENQIPGEMLTPCFTSEADFENAYKSSVFYVSENYLSEYRNHMVAMHHVANIAKSYILNNWKKIDDWSDLEITFIHGPTGEATTYYKYTPINFLATFSKEFEKIEKKIDKENKKRHNPLIQIDEVVLDPTDGDFSVTVNGKNEHWWIQDEAVILLADYIEKKLKSNNATT